ncbi:MAG TPA: hypothetical protein VFO41_10550 [Alphaproteobacteria bacterium]|nr:hypothetical protein [Alphaproteobacteria bacterium]
MAGLWGLALTSCRDVSAGQTCYIYAHGRNVIWREAEGAPDAVDNADDNDADGPRTLLIDWDGIGEEIEVDVPPQQSDESGVIAFMKPGGAGFCSGTYAFDDSINATWSLACDDETSASGKFRYYSSVDEGDGWGTDDSGRKVRLTLLPPA